MTNEQVTEYSKFIYGITKKFRNYRYKDDLFQAGYIGLMKAYKKYDSTKGAKFTTYAYLSIIGEMCKLMREDRNMKVSYHLSSLSLKVEKIANILAQTLGRYPNIEEISAYLEVEENDIIEALLSTSPVSSTDEVIYNDGKEITFYDVIPKKEVSIDTLISFKESLKSLNQEERILLEKSIYYDYTQQEIADMLGINQVQVSRKIRKIKMKVLDEVA